MDPVLKAVLLSWEWRLDVILLLSLAGALYTSGWWRLRQRTRHSKTKKRSHLGAGWRPISYLSGLLFIGFALLSPIDVLAAQLFTLHMVQHLLLIMIAPPLLLITNPLPFIIWGLPARVRHPTSRAMANLLNQNAPFRRKLKMITTPGISWMIWVIVIVGWHDPNAYNAALTNEIIHDIEHLSFFLVGLLFWWHVTGAGPRIHKQFGQIGRIIFVLSAIPPNMITGVVIAFASEPIYAYATGFFGLSVLDDQQLGAVIMWIPGSMMYIIAALFMVARLGHNEQNKTPLPRSNWETNENLTAPGFE